MEEQRIKLLYILGTSFSGSTLLGYLIGTAKKVENLGELKFYSRVRESRDEVCSCGEQNLDCSFWSPLYKNNYKIFGRPSIWRAALDIARAAFRRPTPLQQVEGSDELRFLQEAKKMLLEENKEGDYLLDTSKSVWRLARLVNCKNIDVTTIYIKRDILGNVGTFKSRGLSVWRGLFTCVMNNWLMGRFLEVNNIPAIKIDYIDFCNSTDAVMRRIGEDLHIDLSGYREGMGSRTQHMAVGNKNTQKQFMTGFKGVKYDDSWKKVLTKTEKRIIKAIG